MINVNEESLVITIRDTAPQERLQWILKALVASMRWEALAPADSKYTTDSENKIVLTQLMEEMLE